jgi:hypothetical protein
MADPESTRVTVRRQQHVRTRLQDQILAWARDNASGLLRYIMELSERERGGACGCICISCAQPLIAVNAAKVQWEIRPHFRHESGTETHSCQILSARAALLASLQEGDLIVLPRLRRSVTFQGFSGTVYEGWTEVAPQQVRVGQVHFTDVTTAEIVLGDGRRLQVVVTGSASVDGAGETLIPRIEICVDDPELAAMSPDELRARLVPEIEAGSWCGHWPDADGDAAAREDAKRAAGDAFDWDEDAGDLPADLRRESLLHREVKAILERATSILVPGWKVSSTGAVETVREQPARAELAGAKLEKKLGRIIPDVIAQLTAGGELLVEVTVTNTITAERIERIRAVNMPTLEIDFSRMAGVISRDTLRELVLNNVAGKVWLHNPSDSGVARAQSGVARAQSWVARAQEQQMLDFGPGRPSTAATTKQKLRDIPATIWASRYLSAVRELARIDYEVDERELREPVRDRQAALDAVLAAADGLHVHGYPEALDHRLFDKDRTVLHRLMSIMMGHPVAYRYEKVWQVINSMLTDVTPEAKSWHALYHLAIKAREGRLGLTAQQETRLEKWRAEVRASIRAGDNLYRRDRRYDRLFALLFPDLVPDLDNVFLTRTSPNVDAPLVMDQPELVDERFFREPDSEYWIWAHKGQQRDYELELAASRARIDGWAVEETSILYHLVREKHSTSYVSTLATIVGAEVGGEPATVLRFLVRNGFIVLSRTASRA